jgi:hypothetical protein
MKSYPYRFKTKEEFIKEFGENWFYNINDSVRNTWCWASPAMDYLFGTVLKYDFSDDVNSIRIEDYDSNYCTYIVTKNMLTENKPQVPNYKPRKLREI